MSLPTNLLERFGLDATFRQRLLDGQFDETSPADRAEWEALVAQYRAVMASLGGRMRFPLHTGVREYLVSRR